MAIASGGAAGLAPLFTTSSELAAVKGTLSWGSQAMLNGWSEVDYADVLGDAFTAPGLNGLVSGGFDVKPFSTDPGGRYRIQGVLNSKPSSQFFADASVSILTGVIGDGAWIGLKPLLRTTSERSIMYFSTQIGLSVGQEGANKLVENAYE